MPDICDELLDKLFEGTQVICSLYVVPKKYNIMEKLQGEIGDVLKQSITTQNVTTGVGISDCVNFSFSIFKIIGISGTFCKSGTLEFTLEVGNVKVATDKIDISNKEYCHKVSVGIEEIKYCFYLKGTCLYTKGYIDGWLHSKKSWDEKIVCLP